MYAVKSSHIRKCFDQILGEGYGSGMEADEYAAFEHVMRLVKTRILAEEVFVSLQEPA
jgi:hypothetical protein